MGPSIIFDKSVLESLNPDEAVWLDQFFLTVVTPLFFVETLADLEKKSRSARTPEEVVGSLAYKTPDLHAKANVYHRTLLEGELSRQAKVDMENGRPHIGNGKFVELGGKTGAFYEASPEEEAMTRWKDHEFLDIERHHAKQWRENLSNINFEEVYSYYQTMFANHSKPKTFGELKTIVDLYIDSPEQEQVLITGLGLISASPNFQYEILRYWYEENRPPIRSFAPYFTHVLSVELLFLFGIGTDLIGRGRPSHKIDVAYLYYLPFCKIFTSNDHLHKSIVPLFLRKDQTFIIGEELKQDFQKLDTHYASLSEEIKVKGVYCFAASPPDDTSFLTTRLWDKYMSPKWRERTNPVPQPKHPVGKSIMSRIKDFEHKAKMEGYTVPNRESDPDEVIIRRMVSAKRGKWTRFPPEVLQRRKNENGEWEDTK